MKNKPKNTIHLTASGLMPETLYKVCPAVGFFILVLAITATPSYSQIDLVVIARIESNNNPQATNIKENAHGAYQIRPIVLKEYNSFNNSNLTLKDLHTDKGRLVADWYLNKRIPQMLRHFNKPVTDRNIIISYNAGISYVVKDKPLPTITRAYIRRYENERGIRKNQG